MSRLINLPRSFKVLLCLAIFLSFATTAYAVVSGQRMWLRQFNSEGNLNDSGNAMAIDGKGNVIVTGASGHKSFVTIKYDRAGNRKWLRKYDANGGYGDGPRDITVDTNGNIYVVGNSDRGNLTDFLTIKYDPAGNLKWARRYNRTGAGLDFPSGVVADRRGNIYVAGSTNAPGDSVDYTVIKYDPAGNRKWERFYTGHKYGESMIADIKIDSKGYIYITGFSEGTGTLWDCVTIKYDTVGNRKWLRRFKGFQTDSGEAGRTLAFDSANNVYVGGWIDDSNAKLDYLLIKYDSTGRRQWARRQNGTGNYFDAVGAVAVDSNGNAYVTGLSHGLGSDDDIVTIKYDAAGNKLWLKEYNGTGNYVDQANHISVDSNNNVYVAGSSASSKTKTGIPISDYITIKYDSNGNEQWQKRYDGAGSKDDTLSDMQLTTSGYIYVTGASYGVSPTKDNMVTIKYAQ